MRSRPAGGISRLNTSIDSTDVCVQSSAFASKASSPAAISLIA
jgi:hypothetical protein